jgi:hypothetical protein
MVMNFNMVFKKCKINFKSTFGKEGFFDGTGNLQVCGCEANWVRGILLKNSLSKSEQISLGMHEGASAPSDSIRRIGFDGLRSGSSDRF